MPTQTPEVMTLAEFCQMTSQTDKRVELLGAFDYVERLAGRTKDTAAAYAARLAAFASAPTE